MVTVEIGRKELVVLVGLLILFLGLGFGVAYGGSQPQVVGHSAGELDGVCRTDGTGCPVSVTSGDTRCDVEGVCDQLCIGDECIGSFSEFNSYPISCSVTGGNGASCSLICDSGYAFGSSSVKGFLKTGSGPYTEYSQFTVTLIDSQSATVKNGLSSSYTYKYEAKCLEL